MKSAINAKIDQLARDIEKRDAEIAKYESLRKDNREIIVRLRELLKGAVTPLPSPLARDAWLNAVHAELEKE